MKCPDCATHFSGKICPCGWSRDKEAGKRDEITRCPRCSVMTRAKYLKSYGHEEICSDCLTITQYPPADREYYRVLANKYRLKLYDIGTHVLAANVKNMAIEQYLETLPRTREQFREYWKDTQHEGMANDF